MRLSTSQGQAEFGLAERFICDERVGDERRVQTPVRTLERERLVPPDGVSGRALDPSKAAIGGMPTSSLSSWYTACDGRGRSNSIALNHAGFRTRPGPEPT
jgi:hypothetical protein